MKSACHCDSPEPDEPGASGVEKAVKLKEGSFKTLHCPLLVKGVLFYSDKWAASPKKKDFTQEPEWMRASQWCGVAVLSGPACEETTEPRQQIPRLNPSLFCGLSWLNSALYLNEIIKLSDARGWDEVNQHLGWPQSAWQSQQLYRSVRNYEHPCCSSTVADRGAFVIWKEWAGVPPHAPYTPN